MRWHLTIQGRLELIGVQNASHLLMNVYLQYFHRSHHPPAQVGFVLQGYPEED
jgi:hypothetical protein